MISLKINYKRNFYISGIPVKSSHYKNKKDNIMRKRMVNCSSIIILILLTSFILGCSDVNNNSIIPDQQNLLSIIQRFPIDGEIDNSILSGISENTLDVYNTKGEMQTEKVTIKWVVANDDTHLYLAVEWNDDDYNKSYDNDNKELTDYDSIQIFLDTNGNGSFEVNEDKRLLATASVSCIFLDSHDTASETEWIMDEIGDGSGFVRYDDTEKKYQAEFLIPLESDINGEDATITSSTRINITILDHMKKSDGTGLFSMLVLDDYNNSTNWPELGITDSEKMNNPEIPGNLSGTIAYLSMHENSMGEIYIFEPSKGTTKKIVPEASAEAQYNGLFKGCISLSYDRTKVAFLGAPSDHEESAEAAKQSEIYIINVDGTGFTRLTNNGYMDGHPAWSPDDSKLLYGCYNPANEGGHIMVMNSDGTGITDLTLLSEPDSNTYWCDEMDPEWLPDGRIVFKTNRYFLFPNWSESDNEIQIAIMDFNWSGWGTTGIVFLGIEQLSFETGIGDHDPVGNLSSVIFERIMGSDNYNSAPGCFTPWHIVEVQLNGTGERTLVSNPFINWLPVYDPTGEYVVYIRSCGYSEARLMTQSGIDLGRFIPNVTQLKYLDWK